MHKEKQMEDKIRYLEKLSKYNTDYIQQNVGGNVS